MKRKVRRAQRNFPNKQKRNTDAYPFHSWLGVPGANGVLGVCGTLNGSLNAGDVAHIPLCISTPPKRKATSLVSREIRSWAITGLDSRAGRGVPIAYSWDLNVR